MAVDERVIERLAGVLISESPYVSEGEVYTDGTHFLVHPVTAIRIRLHDADPWDVLVAVQNWRIKAALLQFDRRQDMRRRRLGIAMWRAFR